MLDVQVRRPVAPADLTLLSSLAAAATRADGHPPFGDAVWRDLEHPGPDSTLILGLVGDDVVGAVHVAPTEDPTTVVAAILFGPDHRTPDTATALLDTLLTDARTRAITRITLWLFGADEQSEALVGGAGFTVERELWQMRVGLPLGEAVRWPDGVEVRAFEPGRDEDAWLVVNNRSFRDDPDQGGWTLETLRAREAERWFDPQGFLLAFDDGGLAGFCWTKVHPPAPPSEPEPLGEIYVIGVDPDRRGIGLGRALVLGGLISLHDRGVRVGMLFVDAANTAGVGLYRVLGFETARVDRAYGREVA
ncbi:MAG: mycothiol synthase, partial [Acidimicrobiia bacterium]|nr:mycothiol synthase [Acidimicrobiia bacterium]